MEGDHAVRQCESLSFKQQEREKEADVSHLKKPKTNKKSPNASTSEARRCAAWRGLESTP